MNILAIPDLHAPFMHKDALDFLAGLRRRYRPALVVCLGDEADCAAWSTFDHDPEMYNPGEELRRAREVLKPVYRMFPNARVCNSNHVARIGKRAASVGLSPAMLKDVGSLLGQPKTWHRADSHDVHDILFFHGDTHSGQTAHMRAAAGYRRNVVIGHVHATAGVGYLSGPTDRIWGMAAGCLIDSEALAFAYAKPHTAKPNLGAGVVIDGVPHFEPMSI